MSRAFVKESDADSAYELPELPVSPHPNRVTARGLALLRARLADAERHLAGLPADAVESGLVRAHVERDIRWLQARIGSAQPVDPSQVKHDRVGLGASVTLTDAHGGEYRYCIVGEDEAGPEQGLVSWVSPLARALLGAKVGDVVHWARPAGDLEVEVRSIQYDDVS